MGAENLTPTGIRSTDRPVRKAYLYRIFYIIDNSWSFPIGSITSVVEIPS